MTDDPHLSCKFTELNHAAQTAVTDRITSPAAKYDAHSTDNKMTNHSMWMAMKQYTSPPPVVS